MVGLGELYDCAERHRRIPMVATASSEIRIPHFPVYQKIDWEKNVNKLDISLAKVKQWSWILWHKTPPHLAFLESVGNNWIDGVGYVTTKPPAHNLLHIQLHIKRRGFFVMIYYIFTQVLTNDGCFCKRYADDMKLHNPQLSRGLYAAARQAEWSNSVVWKVTAENVAG